MAVLRPSLGGLLWRTSKRDVAAELGLPPQLHRLTSLQLSAIERHFYRRQHQAQHLPRLAFATTQQRSILTPRTRQPAGGGQNCAV
jgi:SNF2-related domain